LSLPPILIAGLDPAFANFGIARMLLDLETLELQLQGMQTVVTLPSPGGKKKVVRQNSDDLRRARELQDGVAAGVEGCVVAFGEIPSGAKASRAMYGFGVAVGVLAGLKTPLIEVMPAETKLATGLTKTAGKPEIISWAAAKYPDAGWQRYERDTIGKNPNKAGGLHIDNEHVADAIAVAHAGIRTPEFKQLLALWRASRAH
jgi:hypothetical protein